MSADDLTLDYVKYPDTGRPPDYVAPSTATNDVTLLNSSQAAGYETSVGDVGSVAGSTGGSGRGVIVETLNDRANALALAAGAKPGETVTVDGLQKTVTAPAADPKTPKKPANKRLDDHPPIGDGYLIQAMSDAVGNFFGKSLDRTALMSIKSTVNSDGTQNTRTTDAYGTKNETAQNAVKSSAASSTTTTSGHTDSSTGGGSRSSIEKGKHSENNGASTTATNGPKTDTTAQSSQTFAQGGNGPQRIKGDYSLSSEEGGIHFEAAKDFTVTASGKNIGLSTKTGTITFTAGDNKIIIAPDGIKILTGTGGIEMTAKSGEVDVLAQNALTMSSFSNNVTVTSPAGKIDLNP